MKFPLLHATGGWLRNVGYGYLDAAVGGLVLLILTPLVIAHAGEEAYAVWILAHTLTFYLGFLDLGIGNAQVRFHAASRSGQSLRQVIATCCVSMVGAGALAAMLALLVGWVSPHAWLDLSGSSADAFRSVIFLLAANMLVSFAQAAVENIYEGAQRFDLKYRRAIPVRLLTAAAQILVLLRGGGIVELAAIELAAGGLLLLLDLKLTAPLVPGWGREKALIHARWWRRLRGFALWTSLDEALTEGGLQLNHLLIALLFPLVLLAPYSICGTLTGVLILLVAPLIETFFPLASGLHARHRRDDLVRLLVAGSKAAILIGAPVAIFLVFFGQPVLTLWVPEIAGDVSIRLLTIMVFDHLTSVYLWTATVVLFAIGRARQAMLLTLAEVVLGFIASLLLSRYQGLEGIALGSLVANVVVGFGFQIPAVTRALDLSPGSLVQALPRVALAALPAIVVAAWMQREAAVAWWALAAGAFAIAVVYALALLVVGFKGGERTFYLNLWRQAHEPPA